LAAIPPSSHYVIDAQADAVQGVLEGRETVSFENITRIPIHVVAFDWKVNQWSSIEVFMEGQKLYPPQDARGVPQNGPLFVNLTKPLQPENDLAAMRHTPSPRPPQAYGSPNCGGYAGLGTMPGEPRPTIGNPL
jgi:hypothetical protein